MKEDLKLDVNAFLPLRDVVYHTLRDAILRGDIAPGERLMEMHLADQLGVSRTPIREAIRMLEQEGLAITAPRRGAQVARMTQKDLEDVLEIREALDELAVKGACHGMNDELFQKLYDSMSDFGAAVKEKDIRAMVDADEEFHNVIYKAANNPKLVTLINNLKEQMYRYRYEYIKETTDYNPLISEHAAIIDGLKRKDEPFVAGIMHQHLQNQMDAVRKVIARQEEEI